MDSATLLYSPCFSITCKWYGQTSNCIICKTCGAHNRKCIVPIVETELTELRQQNEVLRTSRDWWLERCEFAHATLRKQGWLIQLPEEPPREP